jgi:DNA-binding GntR family transcriptional regulator
LKIPLKKSLPSRTRVVSKEPIHEQILPYIRQDIISNRWKPGERLAEPDLCREFGISRTPLRDSLKILEMEGLVQLLPHVGAIVTPLDPPDLADKFEVLIALEQMAAAKVASLHDPKTLETIKSLHAAMGEAASLVQVKQYYTLNDQFHRALVSGARNETLSELHETIMWHVYRARRLANEYEPLTQRAAQHHSEIVRSILRGDSDKAALAMKRHLEEVARGVLSKVGEFSVPQAESATV